MIDDEVVTVRIAPQDAHCLKVSSHMISDQVFLYSQCFHTELLPRLQAVTRPEGLSQFSHDDEQGADHADEDQHSETDPYPLSVVRCINLISVLASVF